MSERITRLEERQITIVEQNHVGLVQQERLLGMVEAVNDRLIALDRDIVKYKGMVGGITLVLTGIGVVAVYFKDFLARKLGFDLGG